MCKFIFYFECGKVWVDTVSILGLVKYDLKEDKEHAIWVYVLRVFFSDRFYFAVRLQC